MYAKYSETVGWMSRNPEYLYLVLESPAGGRKRKLPFSRIRDNLLPYKISENTDADRNPVEDKDLSLGRQRMNLIYTYVDVART